MRSTRRLSPLLIHCAIQTVANGLVESSAIAAERAMAEDDNLEVLRVLHREVMAIAEGAFQGSFDHQYPVWDALRTSGWYDIKKAELSLAPVELFYTWPKKPGSWHQDGAGDDEIKLHLEAKEFTKLLLLLAGDVPPPQPLTRARARFRGACPPTRSSFSQHRPVRDDPDSLIDVARRVPP